MGNDLVEVRVKYAHEIAPGTPYSFRIGPIHFTEDGNAVIRAEGRPIGCKWDFANDIFEDGFETGNTSEWSWP